MGKVLDFIWAMGEKWQTWFAVVVICVGLEGGALYFQEVEGYYPCEQCIYTRVWIAAMAIVALFALVLRNNLWFRRALIASEIVLTIGLMTVVWQLLVIEYNLGQAGACAMEANFPSWARLDDWLPMLFKVQAACAATPFVIFRISMADGLVIVSVVFLLAFMLAFYGSFRK